MCLIRLRTLIFTLKFYRVFIEFLEHLHSKSLHGRTATASTKRHFLNRPKNGTYIHPDDLDRNLFQNLKNKKTLFSTTQTRIPTKKKEKTEKYIYAKLLSKIPQKN